MTMANLKKCKYINDYITAVKKGKVIVGEDIKLAVAYIENKLKSPEVVIDHDRIEKGLDLINRWWDMQLFDWELFIFALLHCYYKPDNTLVFNKFLIMMGRGNGKNGLVSILAWYFTTPVHGIKGYNVDIIATSESQAKTSFEDVWTLLEDCKQRAKKFFTWTMERIVNKVTRSYIKFNTSNARTKDGKRTACAIFDEIHEDEDYSKISVFTGSFGKKPHTRAIYITTQGYVRGGVLDQELEVAERVLAGEIPNSRLCPLLYRQDAEEEANDPELWHKANPSLKYRTDLKIEMDNHWIEAQSIPERALDFMTKRMNLPRENEFDAVVDYSLVQKTNRPIPYEELQERQCIGAIDFAQINDFASAGCWFKHGQDRVWIEHTWVCHKALKNTARKIKFPVQEAADKELITIVYEDSINPEYLAQWFLEKRKKYHLLKIVGDSYRLQAVRECFEKHGLPVEEVRSGGVTHSKFAPLIQRLFMEQRMIWGDNMTMRWYTRNTCIKLDAKGNQTFHKIEPKTRKTDGFFALVHAVTQDDELADTSNDIVTYDVVTY